MLAKTSNELASGETDMRISKRLLATTIITSGMMIAPVVHAQQAAEEAAAPDIIVTGVFNAKRIEDAPIAITAVTAEEISQQVPVSAADLLRNVPGVFVNSSLGEIRNVVFSRGVSANSLDGAGGYFYVSLQEDGLPVEPVTATNFGPDYFARIDIMLNRLEALRGGTSTVTGANAPGGIFNYISRTGKSNPGIEAQVKVGLEGDGRNPYYRGDLYAGGKLGEDLYFAVGGFYRQSDGARYPGYPMNKGGQVRANLLWEYDGGSVRIDAKYLNDRNAWFEFIPTNSFANPKFAPGFDNYTSVLPPKGVHGFTNPDGSKGTYDASRLVHSRSLSFGMTWDTELSDVIHLQNRSRYSENKADWNTGAVIFGLPLDDFFVGALGGSIGIPGIITYRNTKDNSIAAVVQSFSGFDRNVITNNLPNQSALAKGILTQVALTQQFKSKEFQNQLTFGAELGNHQLAVGAYLSLNKFNQKSESGGFGISTLASQPTMLSATIDVGGGTILQLTNPQGFGAHANGIFSGDAYFGTQYQMSVYGGDNWQISDALSVDVGVRYETLNYDVSNLTIAGSSAYGVNNGGADGNPLTLFDNQRNNFAAPTRVKRSFGFVNYTGAVNYKFNDAFQAYARYTKGQKAPDLGIIAGIDTPDEVATIFPQAQSIEQFEIGLKYRSRSIRLGLYPFYSKLSNVADQQVSLDNNSILYSPPPQFGQIETIGVEFNGDVEFGDMFSIRTAITVQDAKASKFGAWTFNTPVRSDDVLVTTPDGDADNNPKFMSRTTATFKPSEAFQIFATHNYLGKRAANRNNAWYLPGFHTVDFGASFEIGTHFKLQANVNNAFNQFGVLSWARGGGFFNSLDRQGLTKADVAANPNQLFSVVPAQPRSFWLSVTAKF
jgi:iron complex outermembrane recepter protein